MNMNDVRNNGLSVNLRNLTVEQTEEAKNTQNIKYRYPHSISARSRKKPPVSTYLGMIREEYLGNGMQGLFGPREDPIDGGAADQSGEIAAPVPQCITLRGHAQDHVQIPYRPGQEE